MLRSDFQSIIDELCSSKGLVGAGGLVRQGEEVIGCAVSGYRKLSKPIPVSTTDRWHIGSISKSFTATLIARLVESQELDFSLSPANVFLGTIEIHPGWRDTSLTHLLTHSAGAQIQIPIRLMRWSRTEEETLHRRRKAVEHFLLKPPTCAAGEQYAYSNASFLIAAHMVETVLQKSWEQLIMEQVFAPLSLSSAGFGPPYGSGDIDEPWGHTSILGWKRGFSPNSRGSDLPPIMGPAGTLHMSLEDLAKYGAEHVKGIRGGSDFLSRESYQLLHSPVVSMGTEEMAYCYGWIRESPCNRLGLQVAHWHDGSNSLWNALLLLVPEKELVFACVCNDGSMKDAEGSMMTIARQVLELIG